ncbi:MAG: beta-lactamase family protein [Tatlockia sp.]|nr:beta-lactamase family protein [Tatlockia sp.]
MQNSGFNLLTLLFGVLSFFQSSAYAELSQKVVENRIQTFVKTKPVKAMIYGLWINDQPISVGALGESMTAVPASPDMYFRIGGVMETMLTTVLMQLVEQNRLKLDDKVALWYPKLPNAEKVTVKMLANCTSGYPDYIYNKEFAKLGLKQPFKQWTEKELLDYAFKEPFSFQPGTSQHYSHTDYLILGSILAKVADKPPGELLQSNILQPLSMNKTQFGLTAKMPSPVLHSFVNYRAIFEDSTFWDPSWVMNSGTMVSTIEDLGKWGNTWLQGSLLTAESTKQLRAPDTVGKGKNRADSYFAMGFVVINHWLIQNPDFGGYSGIFAVLPEKNLVFIAYNTSTADNKTNSNLSLTLFQELVSDLAPEFPLFKP